MKMLEELDSGKAPTGEKSSDQGGISVATFFGIGFSILVTLILVVSILALSRSRRRTVLRPRLDHTTAPGRETAYLEGTGDLSIDIPRPPTAHTHTRYSTGQVSHDIRYQQHASLRAAGDVRPALFSIGDFYVSSSPRVRAPRSRDTRTSEIQVTHVGAIDITHQTNVSVPNTTEGSIPAVNSSPHRQTLSNPRPGTLSPHGAAQSPNPRERGSSEASEEDSTSGGSFSVSDKSIVGTAIGIYKQEAVESLMTEFRSLLTHGAHIGLKVRAGGRSGESSIGAKEETSSSSSSHRATITKRARNDEAYIPKNGENDTVSGTKRNRTANIPMSVSRFACPYYKRNPKKHLRHRACAGPGWGEVRRVKEHLYRTHALPLHCNRCGTIMRTEADLRTHQRLPQGCVVRPVDLPEGFDKIQETELRKKKQGENEEQKWYAMYKILFPDEDGDLVPSPYYQNRDTEDAVDEVKEYERFQRRELLRVVRRRLQDTVSGMTGPLEDQLRRQFVDIIRQAQCEVFQAYRTSSNTGSESRNVQLSTTGSATIPFDQMSLAGIPGGQTGPKTPNTPNQNLPSHPAGHWTAERITPPIDADLEGISPAVDMMDCGDLYLNPEALQPLFDISTMSMPCSAGDYCSHYGNRVPSSAIHPPGDSRDVDQISSMGSYLTSGYNTTSESHETSVRSMASTDMGRGIDNQTIHVPGGAGTGGCTGWHSPHLGSLIRLDQ